MRREFPTSIALTFILVSLFVYFEYYYVTVNGVPYRELTQSDLLQLPPYFWFPLLPAFLIVAFSPLLTYLAEYSDFSQINRKLSLSVANFLCAFTLYDVLFYALRLLAPLPTDPLAGLWITAGEDSLGGLVNIFGTLIPTWYFVTIPVVGSVYLAYYITYHEPMQLPERSIHPPTSDFSTKH